MGDTFTQCRNTKFSMPKKGDMILANGQFYSMDCYKTLRNNNVLIVGASGAGVCKELRAGKTGRKIGTQKGRENRRTDVSLKGE